VLLNCLRLLAVIDFVVDLAPYPSTIINTGRVKITLTIQEELGLIEKEHLVIMEISAPIEAALLPKLK